MAVTDSIASEYATLTEGCGLVDRSERGKLALTGAGAKEFLNGQVTNEVVALEPGTGTYAAFLTNKGKMLGDVRILATEDGLLLDTERVALQALFDMIRRYKVGYEVELHKRTLESGLFSLIGPDARSVAGAEALPLDEHAHRFATVGGRPVRLVTTDLGVDVLCDAEDADAVAGALFEAGATAVDEPAAEIIRVEHGRPRYGIDLDEAVIPQEAGLNDRAVSFTKGCYVGQETVARLFYKGKPNRTLRGLVFSAPVERGAELVLGEKAVGTVTSAVVSPARGPIGLALVRREAAVGDTLAVGDGGVTATVVELPFA